LAVGFFTTLTPYLLPAILEAFRKAEPGIEIDFVEGSQGELHEHLRSGSCELALMYNIAMAPDLIASTLYSVRPHVLLPMDHWLAERASVRLVDLVDEPMVMLDMPPSYGYFEGVFARFGLAPNVRMKTSSVEGVKALVASGAGYSILLQRSAAKTSYDGRPFSTAEIEEEVQSVPVQLVRHGTSRPTRRAEAFAAFCHRHLGAMEGHAPGTS
jgi:DNA-binding transcriptional LysR family regulator